MTSLIVTGPARGGTTLLARLLDGHPEAAVASDVAFPAFRSLRDALLARAGLPVDPALPLQDHYFTDDRVRALAAVLSGDLDVRVDEAGWPALRAAIAERAAHEAADVAAHLPAEPGETYRELFGRLLDAVAAARGDAACIGLKDVWAIDFLPAVARSATTRFVVLMRDPRAIVVSLQALARRDPSQSGHVLSYARHWRKHVALLARFRSDPLLADRVHVLRYEDLVAAPADELERLCAALDLRFAPSMLDLVPWPGNSSFDPRLDGVSAGAANRWRDEIEPRVLRTVELVCGAEMTLLGYEAATDGAPTDEVRAFLAEDDRAPASWRSDLGDPERDFALEVERRLLIDGALPLDEATVRRFFLVPEAAAELGLVAGGVA